MEAESATAALFTPAETAARTGFTLDTLRYYDRIGLLGPVARSASGHRRYSPGDLEWLAVLRCLRETGMPIADMRSYAELARSGDGTVPQRLAALEAHDVQVEHRLAELLGQRAHLREKIAYYRSLGALTPREGPGRTVT
ncbi:MerR family transcriptional regulator [Streptomyces sp. NBC_00101]|uniref:MerR family transcriptional regulator n=1 Tax=Streptomyces sp. NBC_00101 TaxID=2975651 RepID=UPI0032433335